MTYSLSETTATLIGNPHRLGGRTNGWLPTAQVCGSPGTQVLAAALPAGTQPSIISPRAASITSLRIRNLLANRWAYGTIKETFADRLKGLTGARHGGRQHD